MTKKKNFSFIILLLLLVFNLEAAPLYYPTQFLNEISRLPLTPNQLKQEIFLLLNKVHLKQKNQPDLLVDSCPKNETCVKQKEDLSYSDARRLMFGKIFLQKDSSGNNYIIDQYCQKKVDQKDGVGENRIPNPALVNCEHTWPQSKFTKNFPENIQKTDLHHLFPVSSSANSTRSNHPFSEVKGRTTSSECTESFIGPSEVNNSVTAFEPPQIHKGNVARAMFYFAVRYNTPISNLELDTLKRWNQEDPVDSLELTRNDQIENIQGNRNPFVDFPELIDFL